MMATTKGLTEDPFALGLQETEPRMVYFSRHRGATEFPKVSVGPSAFLPRGTQACLFLTSCEDPAFLNSHRVREQRDFERRSLLDRRRPLVCSSQGTTAIVWRIVITVVIITQVSSLQYAQLCGSNALVAFCLHLRRNYRNSCC